MVKLLLCDDHAVVRSGLRMLLDGRHGIEVVGEASEGAEAIRLALETKPDVVLMDVSMPHGMDGLTATAELKQRLPETNILILTMHDDDEYLFRAIQIGASGYILKNAPHEELVSAIRSVAAGDAYLVPDGDEAADERISEPARNRAPSLRTPTTRCPSGRRRSSAGSRGAIQTRRSPIIWSSASRRSRRTRQI